MSVRCFLALFVGAEGARIFDRRGVFAQFAVGKDRKDNDVAGGVVGGEEKFSGFVEGKMAGIFAEGGELVEERQFGGFGVDGKGADGALLAGFIGRVGPFAVGWSTSQEGLEVSAAKPLEVSLPVAASNS